MIELKYLGLHDDLFLAGTNFGKKIDPTKRVGVKLRFHPDKQGMITVEWNGEVAFFHFTNAFPCIPKDPADIGYILSAMTPPPIETGPNFQTHPQKMNIAASAQVSHPHGHVFQGKGAGKKNDKEAPKQ